MGAGFGSSAAVAVSVLAGFRAWRGSGADPGRVERLALEVERRQHGRPSGVDHGTVLRGGVQWAARDTAGKLRLSPVAAAPEVLAAFRADDGLWTRNPHDARFPRVEPGYGSIVRWYYNAMGAYWSGWEGYRQRAVAYLERAANRDGGWRYRANSAMSDMSVTGWAMMSATACAALWISL